MEEPGIFSSIFAPIEFVFNSAMNALYLFTDKLGFGSYGLAIILLTIIIKIILYPLTAKQMKSMRAMQKVAPQLKKLQDKYKDNPQVMQQKVMELYQKEGVNPLAGCLPMLIQMPILMAMYYTLFSFDYGAATPSFLWLPSLSEPDPMYILPLISAFTTFLMQKISMTEMNQQAKIMMIVMPLFIGFISISFPSGLVLYWATMNVVQIFQQLWINRDTNKEAA